MLRFFRRNKEQEKQKTEQAVKKSRQTWFGQIATVFNRPELDEQTWDELEELLISADLGVATTGELLDRLQLRIEQGNVTDPQRALELLKDEMQYFIDFDDLDQIMEVEKLPLIILMVGVNGVGKTTSIAKLARMYKDEGKTVIIGAADTFRAAAIEQLQTWAERIDIDVIAHQPGADPGAVTFDTLQAAKSRNTDVVIIDTAGRLHTKYNLMEELKKIQRVIARQEMGEQRVLLALDATTGQNGLFQARTFTESVECDGVFLAKLDGTARGGIVFAIGKELDLPVLYIGTGEQSDDIARFDPHEFVDSLFGAPEPQQA